MDAPATLIALSDVEGIGTNFEGLQYFLEIEVAREVLDVWKQWRDGRIPTEKEKFEALTHYADNDAYPET